MIRKGKFINTIMSVDIDIADYIDIDGLNDNAAFELSRLAKLAREAVIEMGTSPLSLAILDIIERLEPLLRKLEAR